MEVTVFPSEVKGRLRAPSSKSQAIRLITAGMLAKGVSEIYFPSNCDDALAMEQVAAFMGAGLKKWPDKLEIIGGFQPAKNLVNCGESGLAARLMIAISSLLPKEMIVTGEGTLLRRHLGEITGPMQALGVEAKSATGSLPYHIAGPLRGGEIEVDGSAGSQFISGLLMALPLANEDSVIIVHNLKSIPYIDMTLEVLEKFGISVKHADHSLFEIEGNQKYRPAQVEVEGDWSGASFPLIAGAIAGDVKVSGLNMKSAQADMQILSALTKSGINPVSGSTGIHIRQADIRPFEFDATHCPDLFPPLAVLAAAAIGESKIKGVSRLSQKESNRGIVLQQELGKLGIRIDLDDDDMIIHGGKVKGGTIYSHNDHRIAMAGASAALIADGPVVIQNAECVSKSYPDFFKDIQKIGAKCSLPEV